MLLKRKIYDELLKWKEETKGTRALLVEGARRVGKSTIVEEFARNEYKSYIKISFETAPESVKSFFLEYLNDLDTFFMLLSTSYGSVELYKRESLIIFDEIQLFPKAREAIKALVADGRYDYIETGSLISIRENVKDILIPSEERHISMYPLDFEEFCLALNQEGLVRYIKACFEERKPLERTMHNKAMLLFREYMLVGGMPQSVVAYISGEKSFKSADREKRDILDLYRSDIAKISRKYRVKVATLFDNIPGLLSKHEKRIIFSDIKKGTSANDYENALFWLKNSMLTNNCFRTTNLELNEDRGFVKCYLLDTGLLTSLAFSEKGLVEEEVYKQILSGKLSFNKGMLYENVIAQMLASNGHDLFFYTHYSNEKKRNDIEIDFIISNNSKLKYKIFPIEVKSGTNYSISSLTKFVDRYKERIGESYVIHPRNLVERDNILYLPSYMAFLL